MTKRGFILLAETDPNVLYTFREILDEAGFRVRSVSSFVDARQALAASTYDAVITELSLEREGLGLNLAREAKELHPSPIVVLWTDHPTIENLRAAWHLQVDYVAFKPVDLEEFQSALNRLISRRGELAAC